MQHRIRLAIPRRDTARLNSLSQKLVCEIMVGMRTFLVPLVSFQG